MLHPNVPQLEEGRLALCRDDEDEERDGHRLVLNFELQLEADAVFDKFWRDDFYARVLEEKCHNQGLETSAWTLVAHDAHQRSVTTLHPLAGSVRIPGVPLHVPTAKEQIMVHHPAAVSYTHLTLPTKRIV